MYRTRINKLALAALLIAIALPASAADKPKSGTNRQPPEAEQKQPKSASAAAVSQLGLAYSLAQYGREKKSPLALLAAAEILERVPAETMKDKPKSEAGPAAGADAAKKKERPDETAESLIEEAEELADDDEEVLELAERLEKQLGEKPRGAVGGAKRGVTRVNALATDVYTISFRAGEAAVIVISGDGDTDLDLYVYDELSNLIAADDDGSDDCIVRFTPKWTGPFTVRVKNRGIVYNRYVIATN